MLPLYRISFFFLLVINNICEFNLEHLNTALTSSIRTSSVVDEIEEELI